MATKHTNKQDNQWVAALTLHTVTVTEDAQIIKQDIIDVDCSYTPRNFLMHV